MDEMGRYHNLLNDVLKPLESDKSSLGGEIFRLLFLLSFEDLKRAEVGNPLEHHLIVLRHMVEIVQEENLNTRNAGAIAILHDIGPVEKIRKADVEARETEDQKRLLEQRRRQNRTLHMREGSALAQRKLLLLNDYLGRIFYRDEDIEVVCEVIRIHDNPSIDITIPKDNHMAVSFREADRLWMLSDEGFACDLRRDKEGIKGDIDDVTLASKRLDHVIKRYREERNLYSAADGPFQDKALFFRTKAGYKIYCRYVQERKSQYGLQ